MTAVHCLEKLSNLGVFQEIKQPFLGFAQKKSSNSFHVDTAILDEDKASNCRSICGAKNYSLAVSSTDFGTCQSCSCIGSLINLSDLHLISEPPSGCRNEVFHTENALNKCSDVAFMDPKKPKFPYIGLATVPGSGNTWTRALLEKLTGVYTGCIGFSAEIYDKRNLRGEREFWKSGTTTFIKYHPFYKHENYSEGGKRSYRACS